MIRFSLGTEGELSSLGPIGPETRRQYRFGEYKLDLEGGFLRRGSEEVPLRAKSFEVLTYLVERHGRLVTKAELIEAVWPDATVTDNSLAQCLLEIRRVLDDDAQQLIRTVARRGYLFAAPVTSPSLEFHRSPTQAAPTLVPLSSKRVSWKILASTTLFLALVAAGIVIAIMRRPVIQEPASYTQITSFTDSAVAPVLSRDGRMLAFFRSTNAFGTADQIWVKLLPNGEPVQVSHEPRAKYSPAFSPDNTRIAYTVLENGFDTYTVSSLGGDPQLFLRNAAGLTWLDEHQLLYSQIKTGIHMGIVTGTHDRSELREIYFPAHERGMAHFSYPSPDRKWVLVVEMDPDWHPCRVVPFSGASAGREVGPSGPCTAAAWSPDGKWMYFAVQVSGRRHLWRQRFPDGQPEQITFGSSEEDGLAVAPDGRSLITSISTQQNAVWIHDARGERALSTEGYADVMPPKFSTDGRHLYYLLRRSSLESPTELWRADPESGRTEIILPDISIREFDISDDEKEVVFSTQPAGQPSELWLAQLDRTAPAKRIAANGDAEPYFGLNGEILFRLTDGKANFLGAMARDGGSRKKVFPDSIFDIFGISPDRRFVFLGTHKADSQERTPPLFAVPLDGRGPVREICESYCVVASSPAGSYLYLEIAPTSRDNPDGQMAAIPLPRGANLPELPIAGRPESLLQIPGAKIVDHTNIAPGINPSTYAFVKAATHANLFRIPLR